MARQVKRGDAVTLAARFWVTDIGRVGPPDLPPGMFEWQLIEGGKGDMLPAEPKVPRRPRKVGGEE